MGNTINFIVCLWEFWIFLIFASWVLCFVAIMTWDKFKRNSWTEIHPKIIPLCTNLLSILIETMLSSLDKQFNGLLWIKYDFLRLHFPPPSMWHLNKYLPIRHLLLEVIIWTYILEGPCLFHWRWFWLNGILAKQRRHFKPIPAMPRHGRCL